MKIHAISLLIFLNANINAQNWQPITSNSTDEIKDMYFQNENTGFAVVGQGKILKTIDGGNNWNLIYENSELYQEQYIVATNDKVICIGQNFQGEIKVLSFQIAQNDFNLITVTALFTLPQKLTNYNNSIFTAGNIYNNGQFTPLNGPTNASGSTISNGSSDIYENGNNIIASDGHVLFVSTDGLTWSLTQFHLPFLSSSPYQSFYDGTSKMRTVTNYPCVVHISNDNGLNWTYNQINIQALYFYYINAENVLGLNLFSQANPENKIYYSVDSGINFNFEIVSNPVKKIYKYNSNLIFAFGENGVIYKSTNAGGLLSTNEIKKKENLINIYPNPAINSEINLVFSELELLIKSIKLLNSLGQIISNYENSQKIINLNQINKGIYFLAIETDKGTIKHKVIIEN